VEPVGQKTGGCSFVGEGRKPSSKPRRGRDGGIRMHRTVVFRESLEGTDLAQDKQQWRAFVNTKIKSVFQKMWVIIRCSWRTLLHEVNYLVTLITNKD
jgi:hypothetical protein